MSVTWQNWRRTSLRKKHLLAGKPETLIEETDGKNTLILTLHGGELWR